MELQVVREMNIKDIVETYRSKLTGFIRRRVKRLEDAEDIVQDVFFQLAEAERLLKPIDEVAAWLYTVARNRITDYYRKKRPGLLDKLMLDGDEDDLRNDFDRLAQISADTPETEYLQTIIWAKVDEALYELPSEQREVFEMTEFGGLSFKEIAEITGKTVNTLISRKRYAVLYLREKLRMLYDELINY